MKKERRIVVDARMINMSGIGTYIKNNIKEDLYTDALGKASEIQEVSPNINIIEYDSKIYGIKEQLNFPYKSLQKIKTDILHVPHYNVPIFYRGTMIVTIHDLIHLIYPEFLPNKLAYIYARVMIGIAIRKSKMIITVSESTKRDILKYYKNVNPDKIIVFYERISPRFEKKDSKTIEYLYKKYGIPKDKKIIMYVGNLKPHKNLKRLIEAYSKIDGLNDTRLLLVGKAFKNYNLDELEKELNLKDNIIHTGAVTDDELIDFYNLSDLFVFPSLYEGYGLPPLEAMACGTPVIASNTSSMPEVLGDAAHFFNPLSVEEITDAINKELLVSKANNQLVNKGYNQVKKNNDMFDSEMMRKVLYDLVK